MLSCVFWQWEKYTKVFLNSGNTRSTYVLTRYFRSGIQLFKQFMSLCHPATSWQDCNLPQENCFVELDFAKYNTSKVLHNIFQGLPCFLFKCRKPSEKCFAKYLLCAIPIIFQKSRKCASMNKDISLYRVCAQVQDVWEASWGRKRICIVGCHTL